MRLVIGATIAHVVITLASVTRPSPSGTGLVSYRELVFDGLCELIEAN